MDSSENPSIESKDSALLRNTLEIRLSQLHHNDRTLVVSRSGEVLDPECREVFFQHLFASFRRGTDGVLAMRSGKASHNGIFIADPNGTTLCRITSALRAKSGIELLLSGNIPLRIPDGKQTSFMCLAEERLSQLQPGQQCIIGRDDFETQPQEVSSHHLTAIRLKDLHGDTRCYRIIDGILPVGDSPAVENTYHDWLEVLDWTPIGAGRQVRLGQEGLTFLVPLWNRAPLAEAGREFYHHDVQMRISNHYVIFPLPVHAARKVPIAHHQRLEFLQHDLNAVFHFLRIGEFKKAHERLTTTQHLADIGMKCVVNDQMFQFSPIGDRGKDHEQLGKTFYKLSEVVSPTTDPDVLRIETGNLKNLKQIPFDLAHQLEDVFYSVIASFEAEQWCYAYQNVLGGYISKFGALLQEFPSERALDVALFFEENGFEPAHHHFKRHEIDDEFINITQRNTPTLKLARRISEAISYLAPGERIRLCSSAIKPDVLDELPARVREELTGLEVIVTQLFSGNYRIEIVQRSETSKLYARNCEALWEEVEEDDSRLCPGTSIRLGRYFEVTLP